MSHSDVEKYVYYKNNMNSFNFSCTGSYKRMWIYYILHLEKTRRVLLVELCVVLPLSMHSYKVENCLCIQTNCLFVCAFVRGRKLVNILQSSWNWYMLLISDIERILMKMLSTDLRIHLQRHTKVFRNITAYGGKF